MKHSPPGARTANASRESSGPANVPEWKGAPWVTDPRRVVGDADDRVLNALSFEGFSLAPGSRVR
jgi:hypothetical protein